MSVSTFKPSPVLTLPRAYAARSNVTTRLTTSSRIRRARISCEAALISEPKGMKASPLSLVPPPSTQQDKECPEAALIGAKVRVKAPVKVYHVPRVPEVELTGMEGTVKQYVGVFKGTQLSTHLPYKVEFVKETEGSKRGLVKFSVHLKQDEFDYV